MADKISTKIFLIENIWISIKILQIQVHKTSINIKPKLVQIMA